MRVRGREDFDLLQTTPRSSEAVLRLWSWWWLLDTFTSNTQNQTKKRPCWWTWPRAGGHGDAPFIGGGRLFVAVLPRQLTHHFQQSLVLLFELLVLVFDVIQVLRKKGHIRQLRVQTYQYSQRWLETFRGGPVRSERESELPGFPLRLGCLDSNKLDISSFN